MIFEQERIIAESAKVQSGLENNTKSKHWQYG
jgi:hypothetical protein